MELTKIICIVLFLLLLFESAKCIYYASIKRRLCKIQERIQYKLELIGDKISLCSLYEIVTRQISYGSYNARYSKKIICQEQMYIDRVCLCAQLIVDGADVHDTIHILLSPWIVPE